MHQTDLQLINVAFRTARNGYRRPDILNLHTREVFEIKPISQAQEGLAYLARSIALFNTYAAATRSLAPPAPPRGDEWQFLREIRDIRPGLWVPPLLVFAGWQVYLAFLAAPGLILYRPIQLRRRPQSAAQLMMGLREAWQEEQDLLGRLRLHSRLAVLAKNGALVAFALMGGLAAAPTRAAAETSAVGLASRGAATRVAAGTAAANAARRAIDAASRYARPRWDLGPGAASLSQRGGAAAVLVPLGAGQLTADAEELPEPPATGARALPRDLDEYVSRVAWHFLANLPTTAAADEVLERIEEGEVSAYLDVPWYLQMQQWSDLERLLAALFDQFGGVSQYVQVTFPLAAASPGEPEQLAEMLLDQRDFRVGWAVLRGLVEAPAEEVGVLTDEEYDAEIEQTTTFR
jgi:hypothetical protein